jgi:hypothetical protein
MFGILAFVVIPIKAGSMKTFGPSINAWNADGTLTYVPFSIERLAGAWRGWLERAAVWAASVRASMQYRRVLAGDLSREQLALLVAASWGGPARYVMTQPGEALKARRTIRHAARVWRVTRRSRLSSAA